MLLRVGLAAGGAWIAWAWLAHLTTPLWTHRARNAGRRISLTFDDGPDPEWTPRVLDVLATHDVQATFFLVGERAARAPATVRAIAERAHEIASHSWSHRSLWLCGPRRTAEEIDRAQAVLTELGGRRPTLFRPPWGMVNAAMFGMLRARALRPVFWSIQPEGLRPASAQAQVDYVLGHAHAGAIVDLHDAEGTRGAPGRLVQALPAMITRLRDAGYELATASDLLGAAGDSRLR
jgi:peptidoglycan/xylan/chitin deacetylase (PgdA/CDA1 family)